MYSTIFLLLVSLLYVARLIANKKQWHYTGKFKNNEITNNFFESKTFDYSTILPQCLHDNEIIDETISKNEWQIYSGQMILKLKSFNQTIDDLSIKYIKQNIFNENQNITINCARYYALTLSPNYASESILPLEAEIGLYNYQTKEFESYEWMDSNIGSIVTVSVLDHANQLEHSIILTTDLYLRYISLIMHTWKSVNLSNTQTIQSIDSKELKVMTYNIWHNNPPNWIYNNPQERWEKYMERMK